MKKLGIILAILLGTITSHAQPGVLDPTFGNGGYSTVALTNDFNLGQDVVVQPDGKIVVCGHAGPSNNFAIVAVRFNPDGSLDETFGEGGKTLFDATEFKDFGYSIGLQSDGKIVVSGYIWDGESSDVLITRFNIDGSVDNSFGTNGIVINDFGGTAEISEAMKILEDDKIVLGGTHEDHFMLLKYTANGTLDPSFGTNGMVTSNVGAGIGGNAYIQDVNIQDDGKIVAVGMGFNDSFNYAMAVARYNPDGSMDTSFGDNGSQIYNRETGHDFGLAVSFQSDGKIIVGGHTWISNNPILQYDVLTIRLNIDGTVDTSYGNQGYSKINMVYGENYITDMIVNNDDKIVISGYTIKDAKYDVALIQLNPNGDSDLDFGYNGFTITDFFFGNVDMSAGVAIQEDGKILIVGDTYSVESSTSDILLARYGGDGVGIREDITNSLSLFPNPASNHINIELPANEENIDVFIYNTVGQTVFSNMNNTNTSLNISHLQTGTYFILVSTQSEIIKGTFIKE